MATYTRIGFIGAGIMGLDVAVFRYGGFVERPTIWSGVDSITTGDQAAEEYLSVCEQLDCAGHESGERKDTHRRFEIFPAKREMTRGAAS